MVTFKAFEPYGSQTINCTISGPPNIVELVTKYIQENIVAQNIDLVIPMIGNSEILEIGEQKYHIERVADLLGDENVAQLIVTVIH